MAERVIVRQNDKFEIEFKAVLDPEAEDSEVEPVAHLHALTPHSMLLASLGACTTVLLHSYAQHHNVTLPWVKVEAIYRRLSGEECAECEGPDDYREQIVKTLTLPADLETDVQERLGHVAHQCSIQILLEQGVEVVSHLDEAESA